MARQQNRKSDAYITGVLDTVRAVFRHVGRCEREEELPGKLRAIAEELSLPYLMIAAAAYEVFLPEKAPVTRADVAQIARAVRRRRSNINGSVSDRIRAIRDTMDALSEQDIVVHCNGDEAIYIAAKELDVPPFIVGVLLEWHDSPTTIARIEEGVEWLSRQKVDPALLHSRFAGDVPAIAEKAA